MSRRPTSTLLQVEQLEDRTVPTSTRLIIDFTPDPGQRSLGFGFVPRNFAESFGPSNSRGVAPRFLDFNGDGVLDSTDVHLAADAVLAKLRDYFAPFADENVTVEGVDLDGNTNAGAQLLRRGHASKNLQVFVLYLGGFTQDPSILGQSPQAALGFNFESFGRVYTDSMVELFLAGGGISPQRWAEAVASTSAHEFGHMLGLGHPFDTSQDRDSVMNSARPRFGINDSFINRFYLAEVIRSTHSRGKAIRPQNPFLELVRSFHGQADQSTTDLRDAALDL